MQDLVLISQLYFEDEYPQLTVLAFLNLNVKPYNIDHILSRHKIL